MDEVLKTGVDKLIDPMKSVKEKIKLQNQRLRTVCQVLESNMVSLQLFAEKLADESQISAYWSDIAKGVVVNINQGMHRAFASLVDSGAVD